MLESCPYVDYFKNPPENLKSSGFDQIAELEKINLLDIPDGFEFYQKISSIIMKMQDAHQSFIPPFLPSYLFMLPFAIVPVPSKDGVRYSFLNIPFTENYLNNGGKNLTGKVGYKFYFIFAVCK
jgi:hypothetical protein